MPVLRPMLFQCSLGAVPSCACLQRCSNALHESSLDVHAGNGGVASSSLEGSGDMERSCAEVMCGIIMRGHV